MYSSGGGAVKSLSPITDSTGCFFHSMSHLKSTVKIGRISRLNWCWNTTCETVSFVLDNASFIWDNSSECYQEMTIGNLKRFSLELWGFIVSLEWMPTKSVSSNQLPKTFLWNRRILSRLYSIHSMSFKVMPCIHIHLNLVKHSDMEPYIDENHIVLDNTIFTTIYSSPWAGPNVRYWIENVVW